MQEELVASRTYPAVHTEQEVEDAQVVQWAMVELQAVQVVPVLG